MSYMSVKPKIDLVENISVAEAYRIGKDREKEAIRRYEREDKYGVMKLAAHFSEMARDEGLNNYEFFKKYMYRLVDKIGK